MANQHTKSPAPIELRFWSKVNKDGPIPEHRPELGPCWVWTDTPTAGREAGYGHFWCFGRHVKAHRWAYESGVGPIPAGLELDHLCRVRLCVNPVHLEPATHAENCLRGVGISVVNAQKTHCKRGHALEGANLMKPRAAAPHHRACRRCHNDGNRAFRLAVRRTLSPVTP